MNKFKVLINFVVFLVLDIFVGTLYGRLRLPSPVTDIGAKSEKAFRCREKDFHHGLRPNVDGQAYWAQSYRLSTDNFGFKSEPGRRLTLHAAGRRTVFLGDSFTEGIGVSYPHSFVGLFDSAYPHQEVVNMGVASYSPKLYKEKLRHFRSLGFEYDRLILCLDISDIQDEIVYNGMRARVDPRERPLFSFIEWATWHSLFALFFHRLTRHTDIYHQMVGNPGKYNEERSKWPDDVSIFNEWGRMGLTLAAANLDTIIEMQRTDGKKMVMVVYPWPEQIRAGSFKNRQTDFWQAYCKRKKVTFINLFDAFEREYQRIGTKKLLSDYFISGDVHWNKRGHSFVFSVLDSALQSQKVGL